MCIATEAWRKVFLLEKTTRYKMRPIFRHFDFWNRLTSNVNCCVHQDNDDSMDGVTLAGECGKLTSRKSSSSHPVY